MKRLICFVLFLAVMSSGSFAMTWQDVLVRAIEKSNDIKSAQKQVDSSQWSYYKSYSSFFPQLSANASSGQSNASSVISNSTGYGLSVSQSIFKGFSNYFNMQLAYISYLNSQALLEKAKSDYLYNVRSAFVSLLTAQENVVMQQKILDGRRSNSKMIKLFYDSGKEDRGNYSKTEAQVADAEYAVASAKSDLLLAQFRLSQYLEQDVSSVEGSTDVVVDEAFNLMVLLQKAPTYLIAKYKLDTADINKKTTISEFLPSVSLSGNYQKSGTDWTSLNSSKSFSLSMSYPFFPGGSNIADTFIYSFLFDKAREDFEKSKKDISYSIKQAFENLKISVMAYGVQKQYVTAAAERSKIAQARYMNGLISYTDWDLIQNEYVSALKNMISTRRSALLADANYKNTFGGWIQ